MEANISEAILLGTFANHHLNGPVEVVLGFEVAGDSSVVIYSTPVEIYPPAAVAPLPPGNLRVGRSFGDDEYIELIWDRPEPRSQADYSGISGYQILRREFESGDDYEVIEDNILPLDTKYRVTGLSVRNSTQEYVVKARNDMGLSDPSGSVVVKYPRWPEPLSPTGVTLEADGHDVVISWTAPEARSRSEYPEYPSDSGITGYQILRRVSGSGGDYASLVEDTGSVNTSYRFTPDGENGVTYEYIVRAVNPTGISENSGAGTFRQELDAPAPVYLRPVAYLAWTPPNDRTITGYQILRRVSESGDEYEIIVENTRSTDTMYADTSARSCVTYDYIVKSINFRGLSAPSRRISLMVAGDPTPGMAHNLRAEVSGGNVILGWDAPDRSEVTGYRILRRSPGDSSFTIIESDTGSVSTTYTDTDMELGRYVYRVVALNAEAEGKASRPVTVRVR